LNHEADAQQKNPVEEDKNMCARWFEPYDPWFSDFSNLRRELDRLFEVGLPLANIRSVPRGTFPAINLCEAKDGIRVQALIPGVDPKSINLTFENNTLTIQGERRTEAEQKDVTQEQYHRRERFSGAFSRVVSLPEGLDPDKINATSTDGVLTIAIAKQEARKPRQISVNA
jgi:HSP20 family protein